MINTLSPCLGLELGLLGVCFVGDWVLLWADNVCIRVSADSLTHGLVGGLSWALVRSANLGWSTLKECALCAGLAMVVDVDHFIAAKSLSLKAATSLSARPPFHATTLIPVVAATLLLMSLVLQQKQIQTMVWMFSVSWFSHHIRDSERRGLWLPPFGETPPLPRWLYRTVTLTLPLVVKLLMNFCMDTSSARKTSGNTVGVMHV